MSDYRCECGPNEYCAADDCHGATSAEPPAATLRGGDRDPSWPDGFVWSEIYERPVYVGPSEGAKPIQRQWLAELAEELADALHDHNIGRDIRGWRTVSEAFGSLKAILEDRYA